MLRRSFSNEFFFYEIQPKITGWHTRYVVFPWTILWKLYLSLVHTRIHLYYWCFTKIPFRIRLMSQSFPKIILFRQLFSFLYTWRAILSRSLFLSFKFMYRREKKCAQKNQFNEMKNRTQLETDGIFCKSFILWTSFSLSTFLL